MNTHLLDSWIFLDWREQVLDHKGLRESAVLELASQEDFVGLHNLGCKAFSLQDFPQEFTGMFMAA